MLHIRFQTVEKEKRQRKQRKLIVFLKTNIWAAKIFPHPPKLGAKSQPTVKTRHSVLAIEERKSSLEINRLISALKKYIRESSDRTGCRQKNLEVWNSGIGLSFAFMRIFMHF